MFARAWFCSASAWHDLCGRAAQIVLQALWQPACGKTPSRSALHGLLRPV